LTRPELIFGLAVTKLRTRQKVPDLPGKFGNRGKTVDRHFPTPIDALPERRGRS
jgi:hypothetical protein